MNYFLLTQVDENGNETGEVKLIHGAEEAIRYLLKGEDSQVRRDAISDIVNDMNAGDFDTVLSGKFIYEVDCISKEDADKMEYSDDDFIAPEKTAVFEIYYDNKDLKYAFGRTDLEAKLKEMGIDFDKISSLEVEEGKEVFLNVSDPVHVSITVKKLTNREVEKKISTDEKFALEFETMFKKPENLTESINDDPDYEKVDGFERDGFEITIFKIKLNGKYFYEIRKDGKFVANVGTFESLDSAITHANENPFEVERLQENKEFNHCNCQIKNR